MEDFIKNIVLEKKYFELTPSDKESIGLWATNEEEYDALRSVLLSAQAIAIDNETQLSPSVKQRLDERFAAKHAHQNETVWNRFLIFFFPRDTQFFKKPGFQLAMVALVIALIIPFLWQDKPAQYAMKEDRRGNEIEKKQTETLKESEVVNQDSKIKENSDEKIVEMHNEDIELQIEPHRLDEDMDDKIKVPVFDDYPVMEEVRHIDFSRQELSEADEIVSPSSISAKKTAAGKNMIAQPKKTVETSETLDFLMALY